MDTILHTLNHLIHHCRPFKPSQQDPISGLKMGPILDPPGDPSKRGVYLDAPHGSKMRPKRGQSGQRWTRNDQICRNWPKPVKSEIRCLDQILTLSDHRSTGREQLPTPQTSCDMLSWGEKPKYSIYGTQGLWGPNTRLQWPTR